MKHVWMMLDVGFFSVTQNLGATAAAEHFEDFVLNQITDNSNFRTLESL